MAARKARAYTSEEYPSLIHKHWIRLEKLARDKHSDLLRKLENYGQKSFIIFAPAQRWGTKISLNKHWLPIVAMLMADSF
jgi:hypothetical protein